MPGLERAGFGLDVLPGETMFAAGEQERGFEQGRLNDLLAQFQESITAPFRGVNQFAPILDRALRFGDTTETIQQTPASNLFGDILSGISSGASIAGGLPPGLGFKDLFSREGIGGALGGLVGGFGG